MGGKAKLAAVALAAAACAAVWAAQSPPPRGDDRQAILQALLQRDRSLANVHFQVPVGLYRQYLQDEHASSLPPLPFLATSALYTLEVGKRDVTLRAEVELRVLDACRCAWPGLRETLDDWATGSGPRTDCLLPSAYCLMPAARQCRTGRDPAQSARP